jgi:hypothetical protein
MSTDFQTDPFIGCPFETDEIIIVEEHQGCKKGQQVNFKKINQILQGKIFTIGEKAKYGDGSYFTAVIIEDEAGARHLCTFDEIIKE